MNDTSPKNVLRAIARRTMIARGLEPDFTPAAQAEMGHITHAAMERDASIRDLTALLWCSIDNDDSRDLDQLTVAEAMSPGHTRIRVAIADVDVLVRCGTPIDKRAAMHTTSVYTAAAVFPMLPERLSTDLKA